MLSIGYAQNNITPSRKRPVFLAGFGQNRRAETVHDDLTVRALSIADGQTTLILCAVDLIGFFRPDVQEVTHQVHKKAPGVKVLIASTHTHHGPDTMGLWGPDMKTSGVDALYMKTLKETIAATILKSMEDPLPAELKAAAVHVPGLAKNARNPEIIDDALVVIQFLSTGKTPLITFFNFPCHPEVLWEHNPHITADYPGYLRAEVERQTGTPCIFFSGALGGMMTPDVKDHSFEEAAFMGKRLAEEGLKTINAIAPIESATITFRSTEITPRLTNPLYKIAFWRKLLPDVRDRHGRVHTEVNLIKLGDAWLATVPGEMLPRLGLQVKARLSESGARVAGIIGLANDELGYILPVEDFKYPLNPFNPGSHYEETNSIGKEIGPMIIKALETLL